MALWNDSVQAPGQSFIFSREWASLDEGKVSKHRASSQPTGATRDPGHLVEKKCGRTRFASCTVIQESLQGTNATFSTFAMTVAGHMPRFPARRSSLTPFWEPLGCDSPKRNAQKKQI